MTNGLRRLLSWEAGIDGRVVVVGTVGAYLVIVAAVRRLWGVDLWPWLGVPSGPSLFFDARNLTAAWECQRLGYDPLYENPCDPWGRPLMYLRPWLLLGGIGLDQSHTVGFAAVLTAAMVLSFVWLAGRITTGTGVVLGLCACSPAVMFATERANMDVALFAMIAGALVLWRESPYLARVVSPLLVLVAASAKVYPAFALPAFMLARSRVAGRVALVALFTFGVYIVVSFRDITHVAAIVTQGEHFSYGARILPAHLYHQFGADRWAGPAVLKQLLAAVPLGLLAAWIAVRVQRRLGAPEEERTVAPAAVVALHVGALIYLGTFMTANNFDYRLVFLLLTLPQLAEWARVGADRLSPLSALTLVSIVLLLWVGCLSEQLSLWDELASWLVAGLLAAVIAATAPRLHAVRKSIGWRFPVTDGSVG